MVEPTPSPAVEPAWGESPFGLGTDELETLSEAVMVLNPELRVVHANRAAVRTGGLSGAADAFGMGPGDVFGCAVARTGCGGCGSGPECADCPVRRALEYSFAQGETAAVKTTIEFVSEGWRVVGVRVTPFAVRRRRFALLSLTPAD